MITLTQLEYFRILAETQHVTQAAESLHISQTALTTMIKRLEDELDTQLFDRRGRNIYLNEYGKAFRYYADAVFRDLDSAKTALDNMKNKQSNILSFSLVGAFMWYEQISGFQMAYPKIKLNHFEYSIEVFKTKLLTQEIDFVIEGGPKFNTDRLDWVTLMYARFFVAVHKDHWIASRKSIKLIELKDEPLISLSKTHSFRILCDQFCEKAGFTPNTIIECYNSLWQTAFSKFNGVSLVASFDKSNNVLGTDVVYIPIEDSFARYPINMYWLKGRTFTPAMQDFYDYFTHWFDKNRERIY